MTHWKDGPYRLEVKEGEKKAICKCGKTKTPPFCDGSHKGSGIEPYRVTFDENKRVSVCGCGKSANMPFCDGSHSCASS